MWNSNCTSKQRLVSRSQLGFTLIEIMVVVLIIGLLSAVIAPQFFGQVDEARITKAESDIQSISQQLALYRLDNFDFPSTSQGIQALVTNPGNTNNWSGYLNKLPKDPWNNDYQYLYPGQRNSNGFDLWSLGADKAPGGEGNAADIGNWNN